VRWVALLCGLAASLAVVAQEEAPKKKKSAAKKKPPTEQVRGKPTPEQIRKFNELQKKQ
jgi:hypothetical protein